MTVENNPQFPSDLVSSAPAITDNRFEGAQHLRNIKSVIKTTFPNLTAAVTATATRLNAVASAFQDDGSSTYMFKIKDATTRILAFVNGSGNTKFQIRSWTNANNKQVFDIWAHNDQGIWQATAVSIDDSGNVTFQGPQPPVTPTPSQWGGVGGPNYIFGVNDADTRYVKRVNGMSSLGYNSTTSLPYVARNNGDGTFTYWDLQPSGDYATNTNLNQRALLTSSRGTASMMEQVFAVTLNGTGGVGFPQAFPSGCMGVWVQEGNTNFARNAVSGISSTGFTYNTDASNTHTIWVRALGWR